MFTGRSPRRTRLGPSDPIARLTTHRGASTFQPTRTTRSFLRPHFRRSAGQIWDDLACRKLSSWQNCQKGKVKWEIPAKSCQSCFFQLVVRLVAVDDWNLAQNTEL